MAKRTEIEMIILIIYLKLLIFFEIKNPAKIPMIGLDKQVKSLIQSYSFTSLKKEEITPIMTIKIKKEMTSITFFETFA